MIVIGAGVAGLTAGSCLARHGFAVKVLEAAARTGGCCGDVQVHGYTFNQGAQYLILPALLDHVFGRLGVDRRAALPLRPVRTSQTVSLDDGVVITVGEGLRVTASSAEIDVAGAQRELEHMIHKWQPLLRLFADEKVLRGPFSYRRLLAQVWRHLPKFRRTLQAELQALFSDGTFRAAVAGLLTFAGAHPRNLPAPSIIALVSLLSDGMALPEGGMGRIPEALEETLRQNGGELLLNAAVERILLRDGRVCAVEVQDLGQLQAEYVISTVSAVTTYGRLVAAEAQPGRLRKKVQGAPLSSKAFSIQLGLRNVIDTPSHLNHVLPTAERLHQYFAPPSGRVAWGYYSVPTVVIPELAPTGCSLVELCPAIRSDEPSEHWDSDRSHRFAEEAIGWLAERHELKIAATRIRSPRDFQEQLRLHEGAIYGLSPAAGALGLFPHRSPIPGLYLAGQTTYPGFGVPSTALSGIYAAEALMAGRQQ